MCGWRSLCLEVRGEDSHGGVNVPDGFDIRLQVQTRLPVRTGLVVDDRRVVSSGSSGIWRWEHGEVFPQPA